LGRKSSHKSALGRPWEDSGKPSYCRRQLLDAAIAARRKGSDRLSRGEHPPARLCNPHPHDFRHRRAQDRSIATARRKTAQANVSLTSAPALSERCHRSLPCCLIAVRGTLDAVGTVAARPHPWASLRRNLSLEDTPDHDAVLQNGVVLRVIADRRLRISGGSFRILSVLSGARVLARAEAIWCDEDARHVAASWALISN
jgi:hypothetical protein